MKKIATLILLWLVCHYQMNGQVFTASTMAEVNGLTTRISTSFGLKWQNGMETGGFYVTPVNSNFTAEGEYLASTLPFAGFFFADRIYSTQHIEFRFIARAGLLDGTQLLIHPQLYANYLLGKHIMLTGGVGINGNQSTLNAGLSINLGHQVLP